MQELIRLVPRVAIFVAGVAAGAITLARREGPGMDPAAVADLKRSLSEMERRLADQDAAQTARLENLEARLDNHATRLEEHSQKLADIPSTSQIVAAMEQLLQKTMASLDDRLTTQAHSIDVLKTTVSQTDSLLERVLDSLDSLQGFAEPSEPAEEPVALGRAV
jgi:chromosome segregation ATPase